MKILKSLKLVFHSLKLITNPDNNIKSLIYIGDQLALSKASSFATKQLFKNKTLSNMYDDKNGLSQDSLESLKKYKPKTLGSSMYHFYTSNNLNLYPMKNIKNYKKEVYLSERIRKTHDILHLILDYKTDLIGEAKVNAFVVNHTKMPMSALIICGILIKYFFNSPIKFQKVLNGIVDGWERGNQCSNFLLQDWESMYSMDLEMVKQKYFSTVKIYQY
ncbi:MAG: Coq4 family protein [Saprospiraceae bacterium]